MSLSLWFVLLCLDFSTGCMGVGRRIFGIYLSSEVKSSDTKFSLVRAPRQCFLLIMLVELASDVSLELVLWRCWEDELG